MARTLETFPPVRGRISQYPWDRWLDGQIWELVAGEDFTSKPATFKANAQTQARKRGGRVSTRQSDPRTVVMQFRR